MSYISLEKAIRFQVAAGFINQDILNEYLAYKETVTNEISQWKKNNKSALESFFKKVKEKYAFQKNIFEQKRNPMTNDLLKKIRKSLAKMILDGRIDLSKTNQIIPPEGGWKGIFFRNMDEVRSLQNVSFEFFSTAEILKHVTAFEDFKKGYYEDVEILNNLDDQVSLEGFTEFKISNMSLGFTAEDFCDNYNLSHGLYINIFYPESISSKVLNIE